MWFEILNVDPSDTHSHLQQNLFQTKVSNVLILFPLIKTFHQFHCSLDKRVAFRLLMALTVFSPSG